MGFIKLSSELTKKAKILLDNTFILEYMPYAPESYTKVYLTGLIFSHDNDNELKAVALLLNMDTSSVLDAFAYWKEQGLVNLCMDPVSVEYLPVIPPSAQIKKYSKEKYKAFNAQLNKMMTRAVLPNEFNEYYNLMESFHIEVEAMLTIIGYCQKLKGSDIGYQYILTVARSMAAENLTTFDRIQDRLSQLDLNDADLKAVLKSLSLKRMADHHDKSLLLKWKNEYGFLLETIIGVAKTVKKGGMQTLDMLLGRYYEHHLFSMSEINEYNKNRDKMFETAKKVLKILGLRYDSLDYIIETYILTWLNSGFSEEAIYMIADYCFKRSVRDLEGMNTMLNRFYKQGLVNAESITEFLLKSIQADESIKHVFSLCNISRIVTSRDRDYYRTWTKEWNIEQNLLEYACSLSKDKSNPLAYLNSILASYFEKGIRTVEDAKALPSSASYATPLTKKETFVKRNLSSEELNAMIDRLTDDEL